MIIGEDFVWGHLGRTGGHATRTLLLQVPEIIRFYHTRDEHGVEGQHMRFPAAVERGLVDLEQHELVMGVRRLPSFIMSFHWFHYLGGNKGHSNRPTADAMARSQQGDQELREFTADGQYGVDIWFRMECLRDDVLAFLSRRVELSAETIRRIMTAPTDSPLGYDHDFYRTFSVDQIQSLYENNPLWSSVEKRVYGASLA